MQAVDSAANAAKPAAPAAHWDDPLRLEAQLSAHERLVRDAAAAYARDKLMPRIVAANRKGEFDRAVVSEMGEAGFLGCLLPEAAGGGGGSHVCYGLIAREIERADSAYRSAFSVQSALAMGAIFNFGDEAQKDKFLPSLTRGETVGCFGLTEPDSGSDAGAMKTRAVARGGGYALSGVKTWISGAPIADVAVVWAKLDGEIRPFALTRGMRGLSTPAIAGKLSLRASATGQIVMDDVFVPAENLLPNGRGMGAVLKCLTKARFTVAWGAMGAAEFCWHAARDYAMNRIQFGAPLAAKQLIQKKLADMQTEIALGLQGCLRAARLLDEDACPPQAVSLIKRNCCGKALAIARAARDIHGANGVADEFHIMRHAANLEATNTYEGAHDIHALVLGRAQTGFAAF